MAPVSDIEVDVASVSEGGVRGRRGGPLSREDCLCPVCLEIFLEPVTLPCQHTFCKGCFLESVDKATLCCPLCRKRVSTWARQNGRNKTLVNELLWRQIQAAFPQQCQRRLSGQDGDDDDHQNGEVPRPRVSQPGELRQEYEDQISKLAEEKRALEEAERRASEEYIQRLLAEEEERLLEERRRQQEKQLEDDEKLARLLSHELNSSPVSLESARAAEVASAKKKQKTGVGQIEKFLCPLVPKSSTSDSSPTSSFMANKENILQSSSAESAMPKLDYYGSQTDGFRSESPDGYPPEDQVYSRSFLNGDAGPSSGKRKNSELEATEEEEAVTKRGCSSLPSTSASSSSSSMFLQEAAGEALQEISEWEAELLSRRRQEEEDRRLALLLQKQLDQEETQKATDRRKGSTDPYPLRQKRRAEAESATGAAPEQETPRKTDRPHCPSSSVTKKTPKTSNPSSSSSSANKKTVKTSSPSTPLHRGGKQATLTEMFPSLGS